LSRGSTSPGTYGKPKALIGCDALGLEGAAYCCGYIQAWLAGDEIPEKSAQRIFAAAGRILSAGTAAVPEPAS